MLGDDRERGGQPQVGHQADLVGSVGDEDRRRGARFRTRRASPPQSPGCDYRGVMA
jgi:hypothetical protein